jgi:uncharacterized protein
MNLLAALLPLMTLTFAADPTPAPAPQHLRVLLVAGVDYPGHLWKETAPAIRNLLEKDKRMEVRLVEDPAFLAAETIFDYDILFMHFKNYDPIPRETQVRENLEKFVKRGKGMVFCHFACGAFPDWPEFGNLAGKVWDQKLTHDPRGPFTVQIAESEHPITKGMKDFQADDELYFCLKGDRPVKVLATARSKVNGKDHPMAFVFEYGEGRVFHTPLGHDVHALEMPGVAELLRRGTLWTGRIDP